MSGKYPNNKKFALAIIDDTDVSTLDSIKPVYDLLHQLGIHATKTVWPVDCPEGSKNYAGSQTLEHSEYRRFVQDLARRGFEITWHGATMESSRRERTIRALELYRQSLGTEPRIHINHAYNGENMYWGSGRLDSALVSSIYRLFGGKSGARYQGHVVDSPYWWGDHCQSTFTYGRNLSFGELNLEQINPSMPYVDPKRPLIPRWFSTSDADDVNAFNAILAVENQNRLERQQGFTIITTHFGKGFSTNGEVNPITRSLLTRLSERPGWFAPAGDLLDWLWQCKDRKDLPEGEWRSMQWRWLRDLGNRRLSRVRG